MNTTVIIGQILGFVNVILGFVSYQCKSDKKILLVHSMICAVFSAHYLLIGATPAAVMNGIGLLRDITYIFKDKKFYSPKIFPVLFALIMLIMGILSSNGIHSVFIISGLVINTLCLSLKNPQSIRKSILVTCPLVLIYDIFERSAGGIIFETISIISAIVGIIRYSKKPCNDQASQTTKQI